MFKKDNKLKEKISKILPRFSVHYVAYSVSFLFVVFSIIHIVSATTPNPGHPWSELGDGVFSVTYNQTAPRTYTFPDANATVLTTNAPVTVAQGGTGLTTIASGSILGANLANTLSAITSTTGTKVLTNTDGTISWENEPDSMVYPSAGIAVSTGSAWGTSITSSSLLISNISDEVGTGYLVFNDSPSFTTKITTPLILGGTSTTQDLSFQTTSGIGATGADMHFKVGNNGATEAMTILNNGYVGIGTTGPSDKLSVIGGNIAIDASSKIYNGSAADSAGIRFPSSVTDIAGYNGIIFRSSTVGIASQTERMRITNTGSVGIGTTAPTAVLHLKAGTATAGTAPLKLTSGVNLTTGEAGAMEYDGVELYFTPSGTTRETIAYLSDLTSGLTGYVPYTGATTNVDLGVHNLTVDTNTLFVDSVNHRVGVGTTTPTYLLTLKSPASNTISFSLEKTGATTTPALTAYEGSSTQGVMNFYDNGSAIGAKIQGYGDSYFNGGNVGIGTTSPFSPASINKVLNIYKDTGSVGLNLSVGLEDYEIANVAGDLWFIDDNSTKIVVKNTSGNLLINTTTDNGVDKLQVNGSLSTVGNVRVNKRTDAYRYVDIYSDNVYGYIQVKRGDTDAVRELILQPSGSSVGIGTTSPTAVLHLKAGTATAGTAPLKLTSGVNLTTGEAGAMEYDGTDLFFTPSTTRETVAFLSDITASAHNPVTLGTANGLSLSTQQLSLALASTSTTGALSSTDWNTFNNKQATLVSGTNIKTINSASLLGSGDIALQTPLVADTDYLTPGTASSTYALATNGTYYIEGTGTVAGTWLGSHPNITSYYDGLTVRYYTPIAGAATTTLNINSLGAKTIYYAGATKLTTHYPALSVITLTYSATQNGGSWFVQPFYADGNESYTVRWSSTLQAGAPIYDYKLVMFGASDGKVYPLTLETGTATTKTVSSVEFNPMSPVLYYGSTTDIALDGTSASYWYEGVTSANLHYTANQASGWTAYTPIYIKGTITSSGNFLLAGAGTVGGTAFLTQTLPTTEDGFVYMLLGHTYNTTTAFRLTTSHPIYEYKGGKLRPYTNEADTLDSVLVRGATTDETPTFSNATYSALFTGGNVGIGTATPGAKLHISSASDSDILLETTGTSTGARLRLKNSASEWYLYNNQANGILKFYAGADKWTLDTSGNVIQTGNLIVQGTGNTTIAGSVGIGTTTPTAVLHLKAGTATAGTAPLKLTSGINLTTPEAGAMEYNGTSLFFSPSTTRYQIPFATGTNTIFFTTTGATNVTLPTTGTLATTANIPTAANPSATIGLTAVNGSATTFMRSDSAPALSQAIVPTWTGIHTFSAIPAFNGGTSGSTAPFSVDSNTLVSNLNADLLDGHDTAYFQTALTNPVTGTGTLNYVPKFTATGTTIGNSLIFDNGTNVGIGTTTLTEKLTISGNIDLPATNNWRYIKNSATNGGLRIGTGNSSGVYTDGIEVSSGGSYVKLNHNTTVTGNLYTTGNVGIGTTAPLSALNVAGLTGINWVTAGNSYGLVTIGTQGTMGGALWVNTPSLNASNASGLGITGSYDASKVSVVNVNAYGVYAATYGSALAFSTSNGTALSEWMRIDKNGNVGIGTTNPSARLTIQTANASSTGGIRLLGITTPTDISYWGETELAMQYGGVYKNVINNNGVSYFNGGNVGIGTTSPTAALHLKAGTATVGTAPLKLTAGTNLTTAEAGAMEYDGTDLFFTPSTTRETVAFMSDLTSGYIPYTGGTSNVDLGAHNLTVDTNTLFVDSVNHRVGVGTTSPAYKLDVNGVMRLSTTTGDVFRLEGSTTNGYTDLLFTGNGNNNYIYSFGSSYTTNGRYVGGSQLIDATGSGGLGLAASATAGTIRFYTNANNERMRIDSSGNVGIGTTTPDGKLNISNGSMNTSRESVNHYRDVIHYSGAASVTGTMQITMPSTKLWSNTMMTVTIKGYNYSAHGAWEAVISGYNYSSTSQWYNYTAEIKGKAPFTSIRLASNGTSNVILLGTTTTVWVYPKIEVTDVITGYSSNTGWGEGWSITPIIDEAAIVNAVTPTIPYFLNNVGNLGIGTTTPGTKLDVVGGAIRTDNQLISTIVTGTSPLSVASTTLVSNLNADLLDGLHASSFVTSSSISGTQNYVSKFNAAGTGVVNSQIFDNGTNVGIGTTNPDSFLDVSGSASGGKSLRLRSGDSAGTPADSTQILFSYGGTNEYSHNIRTRHDSGAAANNAIDFYTWNYGVDTSTTTGTKHIMTLGGTGNVGIGTTSPQAKLHVSGNSFLGTYYANNTAITDAEVITAGENKILSNLTRGNLDITMTSVLNPAPDYGASLTFTTNAGNYGTGYYYVGGAIKTGRTSGANQNQAQYMSFYTNNGTSLSEKLRITHDGNVGIGTTSPESILHLSKSAAGTSGPILFLDNPSASTLGSSSDINFATWSGESATTPGAKISLVNTAAGSGANAFTFYTKNTSGVVAERVRFDSQGNVGIGTTGPGTKLDVVGGAIRTDNQLISTIATGTSPLSVASTTLVSNLNADLLDGISSTSLFNNMGQNHSAQTDFNSITDFGTRFVQGITNGPGTGSSQFYSLNLGLGNDYAFSSYAMQISIPRYTGTDKYISFRTREAGVWGTWSKISAGYADTAGNADTVDGLHASAFQTALTNPVTGTGTLNYIPKFTATGSTIGNSLIFDNGTNVGIGTATPNQQLEITKNFRLPATTYNAGSPYGIIYKDGNRFIHDFNYGNNGTVTTAGQNTFIGVNAGNLTMGSTATSVSHSSYNTAVGYVSLYSNTTGYANSAMGHYSLFANTTGYANSAQGVNSLYSNTGGYNNSAVGYYSLYSNTTGNHNSAMGVNSLYSNTTGWYNSALGYQAGRYIADGTTGRTTGNNGLYLGYNSKASADGTTNEIVIGYNTIGAGSNTAVYGNTSMTKHIFSNGNVGIGTTSPGAILSLGSSAAYQKLLVFESGNTKAGFGLTPTGDFRSFTPTGTTLSFGHMSTTDGSTYSENMSINSSGKILMGATSDASTSRLYVSGSTTSNGSTTAIAGILGDYSLSNGGGASYVQVGNRFVITNSPTTNPNTAVGEIVRMVDNTTLANLVRGLDITSNGGTNTAGTNTGLRASGATFGIQGVTTALAGGVSVPAAIYGESTGTTQGDILRLYSDTVTSAPSFATFYHNTSTFTGTGLLMDFATGSGSFTGNFADFQKNNASLFKVTNTGVVSMGLSATSSTTAVCSSLATSTSPTAGIAYEIRDCSGTPVADYAEMYPVEEDVTYGDIVIAGSEMINTYDTTNGEIDWDKVKAKIPKLKKSSKAYDRKVVGVVSDNYGDFSSVGYNLKDEDNPKPIALNGRVPVKISPNSSSIQIGDYITTSNDIGKGMKAIKAGFVIGKALESWDNSNPTETIMIYVEQGYYNGESISDFLGIVINESPVDTENIEVTEDDSSILILDKLLSYKEEIDTENLSEIFMDRLVAGLEIITPRVVTNNLYIKEEFTIDGLSFFNGDSTFANSVLFKDIVSFEVPPLFNKDTAGFAIIREGASRVRITFENSYVSTPVVTSSVSYEGEEGNSEIDTNLFFEEDIKYVITEKSQDGFTIVLNKEAPFDVKFSWIALSVKDSNIFEGLIGGIEFDNISNVNNIEEPNISLDGEVAGEIITENLSENTTGEVLNEEVIIETIEESSMTEEPMVNINEEVIIEEGGTINEVVPTETDTSIDTSTDTNTSTDTTSQEEVVI
ncbi:TPA: hypothetical protein DIC38_02640 [Candidatus Nomurabacteria bacterium]|nr:MAG: hypothetical protein O210_OD1C00001G0035 [Parcubacteria bacterium RAAC4_OD1_1]HCY26550.1 hypothetical protein [Candidatus Nomurabacteria bacterium]